MDSIKFKEWLITAKKQKETVAAARVSCCNRIDKEYDIDAEYNYDQCSDLLELFEYSKKDFISGVCPLHGISINGNQYTGTATLKQSLKLYIEFKNSNPKKVRKQGKSFQAEYKGDYTGFMHFLNGYCRNLVNIKTKTEKRKCNGICECCKTPSTIQAAHKCGQERPIIIKNTLDSNYKRGPDYYEVDLQDFEKEFLRAQQPYKDHFYFLCKDCHTNYDKGIITQSRMKSIVGR